MPGDWERLRRGGLIAVGALALGAVSVCVAWLPGAPMPQAAAPSSRAQALPPWPEVRGVALQITQGSNAVATYAPLLREIAALGADTVLLCAAARMEHAKAQALYMDVREVPSQSELIALIREARSAGLRVVVMPMVLLKHPRGSEWRGLIEPPNWTQWWRDYRAMLSFFADAAREGEAEALIVGSELISTERNTREWVQVIELARGAFRGRLGYSANWDHYTPIQFWDKLDFVGMTSYYTLAEKRSPSVEQVVEKWRPIRDEILRWRARVGKPLLLTEVGWCSQEGAATAPWNYYQNEKATPAGHEEQRRLYEAFMRAWDEAEGMQGVVWWEWTTPGGADDYGYTPRGKPAEALLREWFSRPRAGDER